jgi:hypothetical protein
MSEREISVLRRGLTKQGWKRSLYLQPLSRHAGIYSAAGMLARANRGLQRHIEVTHEAGSGDDFRCQCGARLRLPDDLQVSKHYACTVCDHTTSGSVYDRAVRYLQLEDLVGTALDLAIIFAIERDKSYAEKAVDVLLAFADAYRTSSAASQPRLAARPEDEAACIIALAQTYDLIYYCRHLTPEHRKRIEGMLRTAAQSFQQLGSRGASGSWLLAAAGIVGLAMRDVGLVGYALEAVRRQLVEELGQDGLWPGALVGVHIKSLYALVHLAEACCRSGIDLYNWEPAPGRSLRAMFTALLNCAYPSLRLPALAGDSYDSFVPLDLYEIACRRWSDVTFAWVLKKGYRLGESQACPDHQGHTDHFRRTSFYAFLFGRDLPGRVGSPVFRNHAFGELGLSTLRNNDSCMATLRWGHCRGVEDQDTLGFTFYANDVLLAPDYGRGCGGPEVSEWSACGAARNTVLVDGQCSRRVRRNTLVSGQYGGYLCYAMAEAAAAQPQVQHIRRVVLVDGLCIINDELASDFDHEYDWIARFAGDVRVSGTEPDAKAGWDGHPMIAVESAYKIRAGGRLDWLGGDGAVSLGLWPSTGDALMAVGSCPGETLARKVAVVACRQRAKSAEFTAALATSESREVELSMHGGVISAARSDSTDYIRVGPGHARSQLLETDGEVAAVRVHGEKIQAVAIVGGTFIRWKGDILLECPGQTECAQVTFAERNPVVTYCGGQPGTLRIRTTARAMRVNGHRTAASTFDGHALLRIDARMLAT